MAVFTRRSTKVGLLAVAVAGLAAASTGMALAAESQPSVQVEICKADGGPWEMSVTGMNQNGDSITEIFSGDGCTTLSKDGTDYWWALGTDLQTTIDGFQANLGLPDDPKLDGRTLSFTLQRLENP